MWAVHRKATLWWCLVCMPILELDLGCLAQGFDSQTQRRRIHMHVTANCHLEKRDGHPQLHCSAVQYGDGWVWGTVWTTHTRNHKWQKGYHVHRPRIGICSKSSQQIVVEMNDNNSSSQFGMNSQAVWIERLHWLPMWIAFPFPVVSWIQTQLTPRPQPSKKAWQFLLQCDQNPKI